MSNEPRRDDRPPLDRPSTVFERPPGNIYHVPEGAFDTDEQPEHVHVAVDSDHHPNYGPSRFDEWCSCGMHRYRATGAPWTPWEYDELSRPPADEASDD